jgi:hypothetical protein
MDCENEVYVVRIGLGLGLARVMWLVDVSSPCCDLCFWKRESGLDSV